MADNGDLPTEIIETKSSEVFTETDRPYPFGGPCNVTFDEEALNALQQTKTPPEAKA